tara:strand:+ start:770 stop:1177 length:408 start_codon:yes stop_codon:yes gene_type:complete
MKTNKAEREAIASKFYKQMKERMILKNKEFAKTNVYKKIIQLKKEKEKLNKQLTSINDDIQYVIAAYNKKNHSEYWQLTQERNYSAYDNYTDEPRLQLNSEYMCVPDLVNAILIAQVGAESVEEIFKSLEGEVKL